MWNLLRMWDHTINHRGLFVYAACRCQLRASLPLQRRRQRLQSIYVRLGQMDNVNNCTRHLYEPLYIPSIWIRQRKPPLLITYAYYTHARRALLPKTIIEISDVLSLPFNLFGKDLLHSFSINLQFLQILFHLLPPMGSQTQVPAHIISVHILFSSCVKVSTHSQSYQVGIGTILQQFFHNLYFTWLCCNQKSSVPILKKYTHPMILYNLLA